MKSPGYTRGPTREPHPVERIKREKNFRIPNNGQQTGDADAEEPEEP